MPESTHGEETEPPTRSWDRVPQRKLARRCQRRVVTPKSKRRTSVDSTQQESEVFIMSMKATNMCQGIHRTEGHDAPQRKPPWEGFWKNVGRNASRNQVFNNFRGARCERNVAVKVKRSGVTTLTRDDEAGFPSGRNHSEAQNEVKEGKQKMMPPRE